MGGETNDTSGALASADKVLEKAVDKGFEYLDFIHTEAGVAALILALFCVYLMWSNWRERRANQDTTNKLYELAVASTQATTQVGNTLDKVYQIITFGKEK